MRAVVLGLTAIAVLATVGISSLSKAGEPLMQRGSASVTPGDDTPTAAVDSLSEQVSPTATANTTATNVVDDLNAPVEAVDPLTDTLPPAAPAIERGQALPPAP